VGLPRLADLGRVRDAHIADSVPPDANQLGETGNATRSARAPRNTFRHSGRCVTLEDWFDPRRFRDDYVPTGFIGYGVKTRGAVKGHEFGLDLSAEDKKAQIAFLKKL
jgi:hypothetical protein